MGGRFEMAACLYLCFVCVVSQNRMARISVRRVGTLGTRGRDRTRDKEAEGEFPVTIQD